MFGKKMILAGMAAVLTVSLSVLPASAHGHGGHHGGHHGNGMTQTVPNSNYNTGAVGNTDINAGADLSADTNVPAAPNTDTAAASSAYPVCLFEGCTETGHHIHDGSYYCGYHHASGYCDGSCAYSATPSGAYPICTFEGCTESGRHIHDDNYYCGYHHAGGYCDGSCIVSSATISNAPADGGSPAADSPTTADGYYYGRRYGCHRSYARKLTYCH